MTICDFEFKRSYVTFGEDEEEKKIFLKRNEKSRVTAFLITNNKMMKYMEIQQ
jgi:hypothetical protein